MRAPILDGQSQAAPNLSDRAHRIIAIALDCAQNLGHAYVGTDHLLFALLNEWEGPHVPILQELLKDSGHADFMGVARWVHDRLIRIGEGSVIDGQAAEIDQFNLLEGEVIE